MSERPESEVTNLDLAVEVHLRLHRRDTTNPAHNPPDLCNSYTLDTIVWETLAVMGDWDFVALEPKTEEARRRLGMPDPEVT